MTQRNKKPAPGGSSARATDGNTLQECGDVKRTDAGHFVLLPVERFGFEVFHAEQSVVVSQTDPFTREEQRIILRLDEALQLASVLVLLGKGRDAR